MLKRGPDPFMIAKLLIGIATLNYAIAALSFMLNGGLAPSYPWSGFSGPSSITAVALWLTWQRGRELPAGILGLCVVGDSGSPPAPKVCTAGGSPTQAVETGFDESSFPGQK